MHRALLNSYNVRCLIRRPMASFPCQKGSQHSKGGRPGRGPGLWGRATGCGLEIQSASGLMSKPISSGMDITHALRRSCEPFSGSTKTLWSVIIFSPPYFFSDLHSSRLDSRLFYSRAAFPSASRLFAANGSNSNGQRRATF
jgi:hypothetical protein